MGGSVQAPAFPLQPQRSHILRPEPAASGLTLKAEEESLTWPNREPNRLQNKAQCSEKRQENSTRWLKCPTASEKLQDGFTGEVYKILKKKIVLIPPKLIF